MTNKSCEHEFSITEGGVMYCSRCGYVKEAVQQRICNSEAKSCEHDRGGSWVGEGMILSRYQMPTCPFCSKAEQEYLEYKRKEDCARWEGEDARRMIEIMLKNKAEHEFSITEGGNKYCSRCGAMDGVIPQRSCNSEAKSCDHDCIEYWFINPKLVNVGEGYIYLKTEHPTCPFCAKAEPQLGDKEFWNIGKKADHEEKLSASKYCRHGMEFTLENSICYKCRWEDEVKRRKEDRLAWEKRYAEMGVTGIEFHYDNCPYKPLQDTPRWDEPENAPECTCPKEHLGAYWKSVAMIQRGRARIETASLEKKVKELEEWKAGKKGIEDYYELKEKCATLQSKLDETVKALEKYGSHSLNCDWNTAYPSGFRCDCGLEEAIRKIKEV